MYNDNLHLADGLLTDIYSGLKLPFFYLHEKRGYRVRMCDNRGRLFNLTNNRLLLRQHGPSNTLSSASIEACVVITCYPQQWIPDEFKHITLFAGYNEPIWVEHVGDKIIAFPESYKQLLF